MYKHVEMSSDAQQQLYRSREVGKGKVEIVDFLRLYCIPVGLERQSDKDFLDCVTYNVTM